MSDLALDDMAMLREKHKAARNIQDKTYAAFTADSLLGLPPRACFLRKHAYEQYLSELSANENSSHEP